MDGADPIWKQHPPSIKKIALPGFLMPKSEQKGDVKLTVLSG
jgi:hypothetical protein